MIFDDDFVGHFNLLLSGEVVSGNIQVVLVSKNYCFQNGMMYTIQMISINFRGLSLYTCWCVLCVLGTNSKSKSDFGALHLGLIWDVNFRVESSRWNWLAERDPWLQCFTVHKCRTWTNLDTSVKFSGKHREVLTRVMAIVVMICYLPGAVVAFKDDCSSATWAQR